MSYGFTMGLFSHDLYLSFIYTRKNADNKLMVNK